MNVLIPPARTPRAFCRTTFCCLLSLCVAAETGRAQESAKTPVGGAKRDAGGPGVADNLRSGKGEPKVTLLVAAKHPLLKRVFDEAKGRIVNNAARNGAIGINAEWEDRASPKWFIEAQKSGADLVQAGVVQDNEERLEQGLTIIRWGLDHQGADGGFGDTGDPFHSVSFFVEAVARATLLLRMSGRDTSTIDGKDSPKLHNAARWLMKPEVAKRGEKNNAPYTHRRWILAAALGEAAFLTGDRAMASAAARYARDGLALQRKDGVNPEKGGGDVNYQAAGLLMAARYYTVCPDPALRDRIRSMIEEGLSWELTNVDAQGRVSDENSSRTGKEKGRSGGIKTIDYRTIIQALTFGTMITGDAKFERAAKLIAAEKGLIKH